MIDVESTGPRDAIYADFLEQLQKFKTDCRYCVFDFPANIPVEGAGEKASMSVDRLVLMTWFVILSAHESVLVLTLLFVSRCPEGAKIKQKMLYSSSYDALKKALVGVYKYVQACDFEEASQEAIEDAFRKGGK